MAADVDEADLDRFVHRGLDALLLGGRVLERPGVGDRQGRHGDSRDQQPSGDPPANDVAHPRTVTGTRAGFADRFETWMYGRWTGSTRLAGD
jgi:hypothetical protein